MAALGDQLYVGETISCLVVATDPTLSDAQIKDATCEIEFYAPPKNPKTNVDDRVADEGPVSLTYDNARSGYFGTVDTTGWAAGTWWYRVVLTATRINWAFGSFKIKA
jgi:hypothetical protein